MLDHQREKVKTSARRYKKKDEVLARVKKVMDDDKKIEEIDKALPLTEDMSRKEYESKREERIKAMLDEAEVSWEEYEESLSISPRGMDVVLQRDISEMMINNYNPVWMRALNANHDVRLTPDVFGVVTYVTDYYSKDESGLQGVLATAVKAADNDDMKVKMKTVANTFLTHRTMGECEGVYKLIPNMNR